MYRHQVGIKLVEMLRSLYLLQLGEQRPSPWFTQTLSHKINSDDETLKNHDDISLSVNVSSFIQSVNIPIFFLFLLAHYADDDVDDDDN